MTLIELFGRVLDVSEGETNPAKVGIYEPAITKATTKNGLTTFTLQLRVSEFQPSDLMDGMKCWLVIGRMDALNALIRLPESDAEPVRSIK